MSDDAYSRLGVHENEHRRSTNPLLLFVENIEVDDSSKTYVIVGRLIETVRDKDGMGNNISFSEVVPPTGYRFFSVTDNEHRVAISVNLVEGRYFSRLTDHEYFMDEALAYRIQRLGVLESLGSINEKPCSYQYTGTSRASAITSAVGRYI